MLHCLQMIHLFDVNTIIVVFETPFIVAYIVINALYGVYCLPYYPVLT